MTIASQPHLASHLRRHARKLHRMACGFGRERDADDILQTLYARWWRRMMEEPGWSPPESNVELFVCVRRVVIDAVAKERRERERLKSEAEGVRFADSPEESLYAFERLSWILARLPPQLAEALIASLSAGRREDAAVARELGLTTAAFTARLFKARRASEELARFYELLSLDQANLMAAIRYGSKTRAQIAGELGMLLDDLTARWREAVEALEKHGEVIAS
jgi:DNA-directed RNA polymerase specialized sigma24 family protein